MASVAIGVRHHSVAETALSNAAVTEGAAFQGAEGQGSEGPEGSQGSRGVPSPRPARSQVSTAVSCEGAAGAAGSTIQPARSINEESALSAAKGNAPAPARPARGGLSGARTANSLISTAVQPVAASRRDQVASSPKHRSDSVASQAPVGSQAAAAAQRGGGGGTPASTYGRMANMYDGRSPIFAEQRSDHVAQQQLQQHAPSHGLLGLQGQLAQSVFGGHSNVHSPTAAFLLPPPMGMEAAMQLPGAAFVPPPVLHHSHLSRPQLASGGLSPHQMEQLIGAHLSMGRSSSLQAALAGQRAASAAHAASAGQQAEAPGGTNSRRDSLANSALGIIDMGYPQGMLSAGHMQAASSIISNLGFPGGGPAPAPSSRLAAAAGGLGVVPQHPTGSASVVMPTHHSAPAVAEAVGMAASTPPPRSYGNNGGLLVNHSQGPRTSYGLVVGGCEGGGSPAAGSNGNIVGLAAATMAALAGSSGMPAGAAGGGQLLAGQLDGYPPPLMDAPGGSGMAPLLDHNRRLLQQAYLLRGGYASAASADAGLGSRLPGPNAHQLQAALSLVMQASAHFAAAAAGAGAGQVSGTGQRDRSPVQAAPSNDAMVVAAGVSGDDAEQYSVLQQLGSGDAGGGSGRRQQQEVEQQPRYHAHDAHGRQQQQHGLDISPNNQDSCRGAAGHSGLPGQHRSFLGGGGNAAIDSVHAAVALPAASAAAAPLASDAGAVVGSAHASRRGSLGHGARDEEVGVSGRDMEEDDRDTAHPAASTHGTLAVGGGATASEGGSRGDTEAGSGGGPDGGGGDRVVAGPSSRRHAGGGSRVGYLASRHQHHRVTEDEIVSQRCEVPLSRSPSPRASTPAVAQVAAVPESREASPAVAVASALFGGDPPDSSIAVIGAVAHSTRSGTISGGGGSAHAVNHGPGGGDDDDDDDLNSQIANGSESSSAKTARGNQNDNTDSRDGHAEGGAVSEGGRTAGGECEAGGATSEADAPSGSCGGQLPGGNDGDGGAGSEGRKCRSSIAEVRVNCPGGGGAADEGLDELVSPPPPAAAPPLMAHSSASAQAGSPAVPPVRNLTWHQPNESAWHHAAATPPFLNNDDVAMDGGPAVGSTAGAAAVVDPVGSIGAGVALADQAATVALGSTGGPVGGSGMGEGSRRPSPHLPRGARQQSGSYRGSHLPLDGEELAPNALWPRGQASTLAAAVDGGADSRQGAERGRSCDGADDEVDDLGARQGSVGGIGGGGGGAPILQQQYGQGSVGGGASQAGDEAGQDQGHEAAWGVGQALPAVSQTSGGQAAAPGDLQERHDSVVLALEGMGSGNAPAGPTSRLATLASQPDGGVAVGDAMYQDSAPPGVPPRRLYSTSSTGPPAAVQAHQQQALVNPEPQDTVMYGDMMYAVPAASGLMGQAAYQSAAQPGNGVAAAAVSAANAPQDGDMGQLAGHANGHPGGVTASSLAGFHANAAALHPAESLAQPSPLHLARQQAGPGGAGPAAPGGGSTPDPRRLTNAHAPALSTAASMRSPAGMLGGGAAAAAAASSLAAPRQGGGDGAAGGALGRSDSNHYAMPVAGHMGAEGGAFVGGRGGRGNHTPRAQSASNGAMLAPLPPASAWAAALSAVAGTAEASHAGGVAAPSPSGGGDNAEEEVAEAARPGAEVSEAMGGDDGGGGSTLDVHENGGPQPQMTIMVNGGSHHHHHNHGLSGVARARGDGGNSSVQEGSGGGDYHNGADDTGDELNGPTNSSRLHRGRGGNGVAAAAASHCALGAQAPKSAVAGVPAAPSQEHMEAREAESPAIRTSNCSGSRRRGDKRKRDPSQHVGGRDKGRSTSESRERG